MTVDTFMEFGYGFQNKSIALMFDDKDYLSKISDAINPKFWDSESQQYIVKEVLDYFKIYKSNPTTDVLAHKIAEIERDEFKQECKSSLLDILSERNCVDADYVKDSVVGFVKNQALKNAIIDSVDLIKGKKYDLIKSKIDRALNVGIDTNIGHNYKIDTESRYTEIVRSPVETPWQVINDLTKGGLGIGDLGVVMGLPKQGKSWFLASMGAHAARMGKTVLHYTLELSDYYLGRRYDCINTGVSIDDLDNYKDIVKSRMETISGEVIIKRYFPRSISTLGLRSHIDMCIRLGKKPDLILIDYADLMQMPAGEYRHSIERLYEDLKCIGGEYECPVWTLSQLNRSAIDEEFIDSLEASAEAASKNNTPDFIMTFSRPESVRDFNGLFAYVCGNRYGGDKVKLVGTMDTTIGEITLNLYDSPEGRTALNNTMTQEERMRNLARDRFNTLNQSGTFLQNRANVSSLG